jgi:predicted transcriptional regulator
MEIDYKFDWKTYSWVRRGNRRRKVLEFLLKVTNPITATQIKKAQNIDITQSAFTLNELWKKGLAECLNPKDHHGKLFVITNKGSEIIKKL